MKGKWGAIEICVDTLEGLGTYIEAEKLVADDEFADYQTVAAELWDLLGKVGVTRANQETHGYDVLLKQKH